MLPYWKMFFVTVPRDPSMNIPMLIRMQWKMFCSTLRKKIFNKIFYKNIGTFGKALAPQMNPIKQVSTLLLTMEGEAPCCSKNTKLQLWKLFPWSDICRFC